MTKKHMKKVLTIPGCKGNANQNHSKQKINKEIQDLKCTIDQIGTT
jgi:hypothetical protein